MTTLTQGHRKKGVYAVKGQPGIGHPGQCRHLFTLARLERW